MSKSFELQQEEEAKGGPRPSSKPRKRPRAAVCEDKEEEPAVKRRHESIAAASSPGPREAERSQDKHKTQHKRERKQHVRPRQHKKKNKQSPGPGRSPSLHDADDGDDADDEEDDEPERDLRVHRNTAPAQRERARRERDSDVAFFRQLQALESVAGQPDLYRQELERLFPPRRWQLDAKAHVYRTCDDQTPEWHVAADTVARLRAQVEQLTGEPTGLVCHVAQFVRDAHTRLYQYVWTEAEQNKADAVVADEADATVAGEAVVRPSDEPTSASEPQRSDARGSADDGDAAEAHPPASDAEQDAAAAVPAKKRRDPAPEAGEDHEETVSSSMQSYPRSGLLEAKRTAERYIVLNAQRLCAIYGPNAVQENQQGQRHAMRCDRARGRAPAQAMTGTAAGAAEANEASGSRKSDRSNSNSGEGDSSHSHSSHPCRTREEVSQGKQGDGDADATRESASRCVLPPPKDGYRITHPELVEAIEAIFTDIRAGYEPEIDELLHVEPKRDKLMRGLTHLRQAEVLTVADEVVLIELLDANDQHQREAAQLSAITEAEARAEDCLYRQAVKQRRGLTPIGAKTLPTLPTGHRLRTLSRKLFGRLATIRREGGALGYETVKIPVLLQPCLRCRRNRLVDARPSESARRRFVCGDAIQVNQDVACEQPDEQRTRAHDFVWQTPSHKLFVRD